MRLLFDAVLDDKLPLEVVGVRLLTGDAVLDLTHLALILLDLLLALSFRFFFDGLALRNGVLATATPAHRLSSCRSRVGLPPQKASP
jgi:hypothetical protein